MEGGGGGGGWTTQDTHAHTHLVQLFYPPDQQWVAGGVLKINIICRRTARRMRAKRIEGDRE